VVRLPFTERTISTRPYWSPDERYIVYIDVDYDTGGGVWIVESGIAPKD